MNEKEQIVPIRSLIEGCWPGEWGTDPSGDDGNCVVFRATDIDSDGHLNFEGGASRHVLPTKLKAKSLKRGDIILEASGGAPDKPVGRVALVDQHPRQPSLTSNFFRFMRPVESIDARFLSFQLVALNKSSAIWRYQQQTTGLINLKVDDYLDHKVWCPSKVHQQKIADILTRINDTIEKTEALIEKYQQIKAGLMHDLFTRGVLPDGKLRPTREQAPELYRETGIGWIPKEWGIQKVEDCGEVKLGRQRSPDQHSGKWTTPYLRVANVLDGVIDYGDVLEMDFTPTERKLFELYPGDILLNEGQSLELVGRSAIYRGEPGQFCFQNTLVRFRCTPDNHASFFAHLFKLWLDRGAFQIISKQTTSVAHLGADRFAKMVCPKIGLHEQKIIAQRLNSVDERIAKTEAHRKNLAYQKAGLMHDLLTGKVAVKVDEAQEEHV